MFLHFFWSEIKLRRDRRTAGTQTRRSHGRHNVSSTLVAQSCALCIERRDFRSLVTSFQGVTGSASCQIDLASSVEKLVFGQCFSSYGACLKKFTRNKLRSIFSKSTAFVISDHVVDIHRAEDPEPAWLICRRWNQQNRILTFQGKKSIHATA